MPEIALEIPLLQKVLRKIRLTFDTWYPWDQRKVLSRLAPLTLRKLTEDDFEWCERLYHLNESFGIPADDKSFFHNYLRADDTLKLIAEDATGRVATFGLYWCEGHAGQIGYLCYLLVDPGAHRKGIGTTLVISALSMLGIDRHDKYMALSALDPAIRFYRKLGFDSQVHGEIYGLKLNAAWLGPLEASLLLDCRNFLTKAGVKIPDLSAEIPVSAFPDQHAA